MNESETEKPNPQTELPEKPKGEAIMSRAEFTVLGHEIPSVPLDDLAQQTMLQDIDAILARIEARAAEERKVWAVLLDRLTGERAAA